MNRTKLLFYLLIPLLVLSTLYYQNTSYAEGSLVVDKPVIIHVFYGEGCPHCAGLLEFLDGIKDKYPTLTISTHEVYQNEANRELFEKMADAYGRDISGVPTVYVDDKVLVGNSPGTVETLENEIIRCTEEECIDPMDRLTENSGNSETSTENTVVDEQFNQVQDGMENKGLRLTIPLVIGAAIVDAINPCAFAVLIILMTAALAVSNKKRSLKFGLAFTVSIYISYFLIGLGLLSTLRLFGLSREFYILVTVLAVIVGLLNIKDYFWYGKGFSMEIPLSWRPALKKILNGVTSPLGAFLTGFVVSGFELPCTGGPYIVILGLLSKEVTQAAGISYLALYNLVFVSPLIILTILIYKGISSTKKLEELRQEKIKVLHLIAGIIMLVIAFFMLGTI